jgi:hypothetical protein
MWLGLYASDGVTLLRFANGLDPSLEYNNLPVGNYYLEAYSVDTVLVGVYNIGWTITAVIGDGADIYEPDNTYTIAAVLPPDTLQSHSISPINDVDWLVITSALAGDLTITVTSYGSYMFLQLFGPDGASQWAQTQNYSPHLIWPNLQPGTY